MNIKKTSQIDVYKSIIQCKLEKPDIVWSLLDRHKSTEELYKS